MRRFDFDSEDDLGIQGEWFGKEGRPSWLGGRSDPDGCKFPGQGQRLGGALGTSLESKEETVTSSDQGQDGNAGPISGTNAASPADEAKIEPAVVVRQTLGRSEGSIVTRMNGMRIGTHTFGGTTSPRNPFSGKGYRMGSE